MKNHGKSCHELRATMQFCDGDSADTSLDRPGSLKQAAMEHRSADKSIT